MKKNEPLIDGGQGRDATFIDDAGWIVLVAGLGMWAVLIFGGLQGCVGPARTAAAMHGDIR